MTNKRVCGKCGAELTGVGAEQLCPGCLLEGGLCAAPASLPADSAAIGTLRLNSGQGGPEHRLTGMPALRSFGDYELLEEIGRGGMGIVYKARQVNLDRLVAVKMLLFGPLAQPEQVQRFRTEAAAAASLQHPNIVAIHEVGFREGQHFFAMDYVAGRSLADIVRDGPLAPKRAAGYVKTIAEAIQYAHERGILHRDLKPSNVLIDEHDQPKVMDFGLAKRLEKETELTLSGQVLGSPNYMPPEQAAAHRGLVGKRSDVYSLGAILYHLLTGRAPFVAPTVAETLAQVQNADPVSPTVLNPHLPRDLKTICLKCLEKEPGRRYQTAQELADELGRWLRGEPILARPVSRPEKVWRWSRRKPLVASLSLAVLALVLVVLIGSPVAMWRINRARQLAEAKELEARRTAYASDMNLAQQALLLNNLGRAQRLLERHRARAGESDLRGWEWRYLWQHCQSDALYTLCQQTNRIHSLAVSHDGKWLAVGEDEGGLSLWDLQTRQEIERMPGGKGSVRVAFSPREPLLAFTYFTEVGPGNQKRSLRLWDGAARRVVREFDVDGLCRGFAFSEDGQKLITFTRSDRLSSAGVRGSFLTLWQVHDGQRLANHPVGFSVTIDPGTHFAAARDLGVAIHPTSVQGLRAVDVATGREKWTAEALADAYALTALAISPDGRIAASAAGYTDYPIRLWDMASGKEMGNLTGHRACIFGMVFWPDGKTLAAASADQTIRLWDLADLNRPRPLGVLRGHRSEVSSLALLPDHTTLASGCKDGSVCLWDTKALQRERTQVTLPEPIVTWRFTSDSTSVLTLDRQGRVTQWKGAEFQERERLLDIGTNFFTWFTAAISSNGEWLAASTRTGTVTVWDLGRKTLPRQFNAHTGQVFVTGFLPGGNRLVTQDTVEFLREWNLITGEQTRSWNIGRPLLTAGGLSDDGHWFVEIGSLARRMALLDLVTGRQTVQRMDVKGVTGKVAFSPDGKYFAAPSELGHATTWETATLREVATTRGFLQGVHSVAFSPDGRRLAIGSGGKEAVKLWDVESHQELLTLEGRESMFAMTAFSPDGNALGSMNANGILHLWRAPSWEEIERQEKAAQP